MIVAIWNFSKEVDEELVIVPVGSIDRKGLLKGSVANPIL